MYPPIRGPAMGPNMAPIPKMAIAIPCSLGGNVSSRIACDIGCSAPPPIPCRTRKKTSIPRLVEEPHRKEATVNSRTEKTRYRFRPKVRASHPVIGMMIGVGDEVGREDPRRLVDPGGEGAADVVEGDVRDARVDDLDQRRQHHRDGDDPLARADLAGRVPEPPALPVHRRLPDEDRGDDGHSDPKDVAGILAARKEDLHGTRCTTFT